MIEEAITGTDGGVYGGVRNRILANLVLATLLGDRVRAGRHPIGTPFPFATLTLPSEDANLASDRAFLVDFTLHVQVWDVGYEPTYFLGHYLADWLIAGHDAMTGDGCGFTLIPAPGWDLGVDPERQEAGGDVWRYDLFFRAIIGRKIV